MRSKKLVATLVGVVLAVAVAPAAYAMPVDPVGAPGAAQQVPDVPPPPSSMAMSAADEYEVLRTPAGTTEVVDEPATAGFDLVSAAIGALAAAGLSLVAVAALSTRRRTAIG
jgi:hypothetical protein